MANKIILVQATCVYAYAIASILTNYSLQELSRMWPDEYYRHIRTYVAV